jgi:hypothetical protein
MKKHFLLGIFSLMSIVSLFAQKSERITYQEIRHGETYIRDVTVNAVFVGWVQDWHYLDGNFKVAMSSFCPYNGEWSDWELIEKAPATDLLSIYNVMSKTFFQYPRLGIKVYYNNGTEVIKILDIPNEKASPIWWGKDGRSFYIFYKIYRIL